ncbi:hypothetical protein AUJ63_05065 [Candidatus Pacearchaeota archaeon CG1_02_35_32]|nr:MAG: hypothetical protein AUJ63_05065 [Candidatus Pacearchaeota archaeon CG1_02_35_32]
MQKLKIDLKALNNVKVIYPILVILLLASISFYMLKEKEKRFRVLVQKQLSQTIEEKKKVENKLVGALEAKEGAEVELSAEKEKSSTLKKELKEKEQEIVLTIKKLEEEITARRKAEAQLMITMKGKELLETRLKKLEKFSKPIQLEKIVVKPQTGMVGKVIMVNKEYAFVVINLGNKDNLQLQEVLSVYRNDEFIGKVQIEKIEENMAAAVILPQWKDIEFMENDEVKKI